MEAKTSPKLIHVGCMQPPGGGVRYLFLRQKDPHTLAWYREDGPEEPVSAGTIDEAIRLARRQWKENSFRTIGCGFRYTLPERDEHGINAFFHQMAASYSSPTGVYFDEELGNNCLVNFASQEALGLWKRLKQEGRL